MGVRAMETLTPDTEGHLMIARCVAAVLFVVCVIAPFVVSVFGKLSNILQTLGN